ncbi:hypothetical protein [Nocardia sp. X0981]
MVDAESQEALWLPAHTWTRPFQPVWFDSRAARYSILKDSRDRDIGLSFDSTPEDAVRRGTWARAHDLRGAREYDVAGQGDIKKYGDKPWMQWVDRSKVKTVPAGWHDSELEARGGGPVLLGGHANPDIFIVDVAVARSPTGAPVQQKVAIDGRSLGHLLAAIPDFWRIADERGGHLVMHAACKPAHPDGTLFGDLSEALHENGLDRPTWGATGTIYAYPHHPDGRNDRVAPDSPDETEMPDFVANPAISSIAVIDAADRNGDLVPGRFIRSDPPENTLDSPPHSGTPHEPSRAGTGTYPAPDRADESPTTAQNKPSTPWSPQPLPAEAASTE